MDSDLPEKRYNISRPIYSTPSFEVDGERQERQEESSLWERLNNSCG